MDEEKNERNGHCSLVFEEFERVTRERETSWKREEGSEEQVFLIAKGRDCGALSNYDCFAFALFAVIFPPLHEISMPPHPPLCPFSNSPFGN